MTPGIACMTSLWAWVSSGLQSPGLMIVYGWCCCRHKLWSMICHVEHLSYAVVLLWCWLKMCRIFCLNTANYQLCKSHWRFAQVWQSTNCHLMYVAEVSSLQLYQPLSCFVWYCGNCQAHAQYVILYEITEILLTWYLW